MGIARTTTGRAVVAYAAAFTMLLGAIVTFGAPAQAGHAGACLDVETETAENPVGSTHTLTATLRTPTALPATPCDGDPATATGAPGAEVRFEFETGPVVTVVDDDTAPPSRSVTPQDATPSTEDASCTIPAGQSSCTLQFFSTQSGTNRIRGWIADGASIDENEPRDESTEQLPMNPQGDEPDTTDVVEKTWESGAATRLDCFPETATNSTGDSHTFTCRASDAFGNPVEGQEIDVEATGDNDPDEANGGSPDFSCEETDADGECEFTHGPGGIGTTTDTGITTYRGWIDDDGQDNNTNEGDTTETRAQDDNDDTDVIEKTWTTAPLNCSDADGNEIDLNPAGTSHTITCTARDVNNQPRQGALIDVEAFGANDPDGSESPASPDFTCTTGADGSCSFTHGPAGTPPRATSRAGTTFYRAWIDEDGNHGATPDHGNFEGDPAEGRDENTQPGQQQEPDKTDVVEKTWGASNVDCSPETDRNPSGTSHSITCQATDEGNVLVSGTSIDVEAAGPNDPDGSESFGSPDFTCITTAQGFCTIVHGPGGTAPANETNDAGTTIYTAWIDIDNNNSTTEADADEGRIEGTDLGEPDNTDVVEKIWIASRLNCDPESDTNPALTAHTITCTATDTSGTPSAGIQVDAEATGVNDPDNADSATSPDFTCTTGSNGSCSFTHGPGGRGTTTSLGRTLYRAWIDADNSDATAEADPGEGRAEDTAGPSPSPSGSASPSPSPSPSDTPGPGQRSEPDNTDVVEKNWSAVPDSLTIEPETDSAPVGSCNFFTITATSTSGDPVEGVVVDVEQRHERSDNGTSNDEPTVSFCTPEENEASNPSSVDTTRGDLGDGGDGNVGGEADKATDSNGKLSIGIRVTPSQGSNGTGNVLLTAFYENEDNDDPDTNDPQDSATKTWTPSQARTINCRPETDANRVGAKHVVTCTVRDANGSPVQGEGVSFSERGPGRFTTSTDRNTNEQGNATATVTSSQRGTQTITGTLTTATVGEPDTDECDRAAGDPSGAPAGQCADSVEKTWRAGPRVRSGPCKNFFQGTRTKRPGGGQVIVGTRRNDELVGTRGDDIICGMGGSDQIRGRGGNDQIVGAGGRDRMQGDAGRDRISGGAGNDVAKGEGGSDRLSGKGGNDVLRGGDGPDTLRGGAGDDRLDGGPGRDSCSGGDGSNSLSSCE